MFFALRPIKRVGRKLLKKKGVKRLYKRKKLPLNAKNYKPLKRSIKYNVNCIKKLIWSKEQLKRYKKR
jgi:hypothetical protein